MASALHIAPVLAVASLLVTGCAGLSGPSRFDDTTAVAPIGTTPGDMASTYERRAMQDEAAWREHEAQAVHERLLWGAVNRGRSVKSGATLMASHCETLALTYARSAEESRELARRYRAIATQGTGQAAQRAPRDFSKEK